MAASSSGHQGLLRAGLVSPTLSNLFLHYVFDAWMARNYPDIPFERYADDIICHCRSAKQAQALWSSLEVRFIPIGLSADLINGLSDPGIAGEGGKPSGFVT